MPNPTKNQPTLYLNDINEIKTFIRSRSKSMSNYIDKSNSRFTLWSKALTHSDIITVGKRTDPSQSHDKDLLYYLSSVQMDAIEKSTKKTFPIAHQSNIGMPEAFYSDVSVFRLERRDGKQKTQHEHVILNTNNDVFLVNDTLKYFTRTYTLKVFDALKKIYSNFRVQTGPVLSKVFPFTKIQLTEAIHGLGTAKDKEFHDLRLSMFVGDEITFLIEHSIKRNKIFILLEKNPKFYTIIGEKDITWERYIETERKQEKARIESKKPLDSSETELSRRLQQAWKDKLAKEMMTYSTDSEKVFCPLTGISAGYPEFSMLFVASHIKKHSECLNEKESYDINNGLLLSANADALFDKYMITIDEKKEIEFSYLLKNNYTLRNQLLLNQPVFKLILNDERMKNLEEHRNIFHQKEEERKNG